MLMCTKCFEKTNKYSNHAVVIDDLIFKSIQLLNKKGYYTDYCCEGHGEYDMNVTYISFMQIDLELEDAPAGFLIEGKGRYNGCILRGKGDISRLPYQLDRFALDNYMKLLNYNLYQWVLTLPQRKIVSYEDRKIMSEYRNFMLRQEVAGWCGDNY